MSKPDNLMQNLLWFLRRFVCCTNDVPESDHDPEEQADQQTPGRRAEQGVNCPSDHTASDNPSDQIRQHAIAATIIRIGPLHLWPAALLFTLACGLEPRFERVDPRILDDGFSGGCLVAQAISPKAKERRHVQQGARRGRRPLRRGP